MKFQFKLLILLSLMNLTVIMAQEAKLGWTQVDHPQIAQYFIYRSIHPDSEFVKIYSANHPESSYTDTNIEYNIHYFYAATSNDKMGYESGFSNIIDTTLTNNASIETKTNAEKPDNFQLMQNYPNPFNSSTCISYTLTRQSHVKLTIFNANGEQVTELVNCFQPSGIHKTMWHGNNHKGEPVSSGTYYFKMENDQHAGFRKMILLK